MYNVGCKLIIHYGVCLDIYLSNILLAHTVSDIITFPIQSFLRIKLQIMCFFHVVVLQNCDFSVLTEYC